MCWCFIHYCQVTCFDPVHRSRCSMYGSYFVLGLQLGKWLMRAHEMFVNCTCSDLNDFCCRLIALLQEISCEQQAKTIIFVETKRKVEDIARSIRRSG